MFSDDEQRPHFRITGGNPSTEVIHFFEKELKRELCSAMMSNKRIMPNFVFMQKL
ncbi:hypothetical protein P278_07350 [Zhouia amylolytica AD3]|uniref:Uncharacterized protein n=1 Tax=Zhouia amylolytica AD3 TaxID=1286632 RepID=W2USS5_9FLAO|nr:hypothetical protein P278_07350 [Zhouia amylolytica AD3]